MRSYLGPRDRLRVHHFVTGTRRGQNGGIKNRICSSRRRLFLLVFVFPFFFFIAHWNKKGLVRETSGDEGGEVKPWLGATDGPADY